jgi:hypothetical protein
MARVAASPTRAQGATAADRAASTALALDADQAQQTDQDKVLPLPGWLVKVYYIFPIVLYVPDVIFNYYVYSDGVTAPNGNLAQQIAQVGLWGFLSIGVVGMAYLLSVLAPWHWGKGHHIRAFFCGVGVVVATGITVWNSLAYRSVKFVSFPTDQYAYQLFPQLGQAQVPLTMIFAAVAPPFWGLFWALVQPTETGRSLAALRESHEERLLRLQQEAEIKRLRAEANARVREAQLRGMAATATAAREQASAFLARKSDTGPVVTVSEVSAESAASGDDSAPPAIEAPAGDGEQKVVSFFTSTHQRDLGRATSMSNHAAAAAPAARPGPVSASRSGALAQPSLMREPDVANAAGLPAADVAGWGQRRPPTPYGMPEPALQLGEAPEADAMTGTTGPRRAVRPGQTSSLLNAMNGPSPAHIKAITDAMRDLNIPLGKRGLTANQTKLLVPRVAEDLSIDPSAARALISKVLQHMAQSPTRN